MSEMNIAELPKPPSMPIEVLKVEAKNGPMPLAAIATVRLGSFELEGVQFYMGATGALWVGFGDSLRDEISAAIKAKYERPGLSEEEAAAAALVPDDLPF